MIEAQKMRFVAMSVPAAAATTERIANLDTRGWDYATIIANVDSEASTSATNATITILHNDTTVVSNFTTLQATQAFDRTAARQAVIHVDLRGKKRYLRFGVTPSTVASTHNNTIASIVGILSRGANAPTNTTDMVDSGTSDSVFIL